jgi:serine/threonine protein phosphatase PrpC
MAFYTDAILGFGDDGADEELQQILRGPAQIEAQIKVKVWSSSEQGSRPYQEDVNFVFTNDDGIRISIIGCADGHKDPYAPNDAANFAGTMFLSMLADGLKNLDDGMPNNQIEELVCRLFHEGNERLRSMIPECKSGTTISLVIIVGNILIACSLGDSDLLIEYLDGSFHHSTYHIPGNGDERKRIRAAGGGILEGRVFDPSNRKYDISVSRALGDFQFPGIIPRPDIMIHYLPEVKTVCCLTDGVRERLNDDYPMQSELEIKQTLMHIANEAISHGQDPAVVLTTYAVEGRSCADNASAVILSFFS